MISFKVDPRFIQDLEDDFIMNEDLTLYKFIGNDPIKAFYLGFNIKQWFSNLDKKQKYLYSKEARHNKDDLEKYEKQIEYWSNKYPKSGEVEMVELAEFIMNNIFWEESSEDIDKIKMAFFFGNTIADQKEKHESVEDNN